MVTDSSRCQVLDDDTVKLVSYSIVCVKPDAERVLLESQGSTVVTGRMSREAFVNSIVYQYVDSQDHRGGWQLSAEDAKHLRVCYTVDGRWAQPSRDYEKEKVSAFAAIRDTLAWACARQLPPAPAEAKPEVKVEREKRRRPLKRAPKPEQAGPPAIAPAVTEAAADDSKVKVTRTRKRLYEQVPEPKRQAAEEPPPVVPAAVEPSTGETTEAEPRIKVKRKRRRLYDQGVIEDEQERDG